jgi:hypothetical protein
MLKQRLATAANSNSPLILSSRQIQQYNSILYSMNYKKPPSSTKASLTNSTNQIEEPKDKAHNTINSNNTNVQVTSSSSSFNVNATAVKHERELKLGDTYTKIGTIQRRLAWPLRKDGTQNREAFHILVYVPLRRSPSPPPCLFQFPLI